MKHELMNILACPVCKGSLELNVVEEKEGEITFVYTEPEDFLLALELFSEFMNTTYEGFDHRYKQIVDAVKELSGKCDGEIMSKGFPSQYNGWTIQEQVWKKTGLNKETFKKRLKWLKDEGYIESFYDKSIHG